MVKIVDVELIIDANDDTIAAASAATTNPFNPVGIKREINQGYAASGLIAPPSFTKGDAVQSLTDNKPSLVAITYATIPGITTIRGNNNFK